MTRYLANVATLEYSPDKCTGCGRCAEVCPHGVFVMEGRKAVLTDKNLCMECGACRMNCAYDAISVDSGVGCAAGIINGLIRGTEPDCGCSGPASGTGKSSCC